jgi:hypothetical protein
MNIEEGEELQPFQPFGLLEDVKYVSTLWQYKALLYITS